MSRCVYDRLSARVHRAEAKLKSLRNCWTRATKDAISECFIVQAAKKYGQKAAVAMDVGHCESGQYPYWYRWWVVSAPIDDKGTRYYGTFQFLTSTWATTPYAGKPILHPKWQALAAMWMWSVGRSGEWGRCL